MINQTVDLLIPEPPLLVLPTLVKLVGLNEAIVVQQIHCCITKDGHEKDGYLWVYDSCNEWRKYFPFWNKWTIRRIVSKLEQSGIVVLVNHNEQIKSCRIDYKKLQQLIGDRTNLTAAVAIPQLHIEVKEESQPLGSNDSHGSLEKLTPLAELWNKICTNLPSVRGISKARKLKEKLRLAERSMDEWGEVFVKINNLPFCTGHNNRGWRATYDWIMTNTDNATKVLEGSYDINETGRAKANQTTATHKLGDLGKKDYLAGWDKVPTPDYKYNPLTRKTERNTNRQGVQENREI